MPEEEKVRERIGFALEVLQIVKTATGKTIERSDDLTLPHDEDASFGIRLSDKQTNDWFVDMICPLREKLRQLGYLAFLAEDYNHRTCIVVLKTTDQYEIMRSAQTKGWNIDDIPFGPNELIHQLRVWQERFGFTGEVLGADYSWIKFLITTLPNDLVSFADEINRLCPELDQVLPIDEYNNDDTPEKKLRVSEQLASIIRETKQVYLWWD